ncbi:acyl carrier protein [Streptomyces sp. URMC 123]|uniref:acyl carrier protein n=1 Tax=Streptomyces sp. URMC 123 TaxID=3423403 RepID=UPI003F1DB8AA
MRDIAERVREFIVTELGWEGSADELTADLPLIEKGILDSLGILSLVAYLEEEYGIHVDDRDIVPGNLGTLADIERYVADRLGGTPA